MTHIFLCFRIWYIYIYTYISNKKIQELFWTTFFTPGPLFPKKQKPPTSETFSTEPLGPAESSRKKVANLSTDGHGERSWKIRTDPHQAKVMKQTQNNALFAHKIFTYICMLRSPTNENRWHLMTPVSRTPFLTYILLVAKSASCRQVIMMSSLTSRITSYHLVENLFFW